MKFIEKPADSLSLAMRKPLHGVGINDAEYVVTTMRGGVKVVCPYYQVWRSMLTRCYSKAMHKRSPSYCGCSVIDEWLIFTNFKSWMKSKDWRGKELDKDILHPGNRVYSPEHCVFIDGYVNKLLPARRRNHGTMPRGVRFERRIGKYIAAFTTNGKAKYLGAFDTSNEAKSAFRNAKAAHIKDIAIHQDAQIRSALLRYSRMLEC